MDSISSFNAALRVKRADMNDSFDRAPGAGRTRNLPADPGLAESAAGDCDTKTTLFNQREPLRQPRTSPPFAESNISTANVVGGGGRELSINVS